jgi:hypothetical protein
MATGRYKAMKARIAAAVARKAKIAGAELRAVEERRKADERDAAMKLKRATERAAAEEASIRRATADAKKRARIEETQSRSTERRVAMGRVDVMFESDEVTSAMRKGSGCHRELCM